MAQAGYLVCRWAAGTSHLLLITEDRGEGRATARSATLQDPHPVGQRNRDKRPGPVWLTRGLWVQAAQVSTEPLSRAPQAAARAGQQCGTLGLTGPPRLPSDCQQPRAVLSPVMEGGGGDTQERAREPTALRHRPRCQPLPAWPPARLRPPSQQRSLAPLRMGFPDRRPSGTLFTPIFFGNQKKTFGKGRICISMVGKGVQYRKWEGPFPGRRLPLEGPEQSWSPGLPASRGGQTSLGEKSAVRVHES